jgi:hypothetical protein
MTRTERLEQSWRNLEFDVRSKLGEANARLNTLAIERFGRNPESKFPSMQCTNEVIEEARATAYASVLDLIHTTMRELGLKYD